jgi:hypothetical protein
MINLVRAVGLVGAIPLIVFGPFLLLRGDLCDGFKGTLIVGLTALGLGLLVLAATSAGRESRFAWGVAFTLLAILPYHLLVGSAALVVNLVFAVLTALLLWRRVRPR